MIKKIRTMKEAPIMPQDKTVFDRDEFFDIMMGDVESGRILLDEFLQQTSDHLELLGEDIEAGDVENTKKTAHLIKGSSLNVTATRLAEAALALEKGADAMTADALKAAFAAVKTEFAALAEAIARERNA